MNKENKCVHTKIAAPTSFPKEIYQTAHLLKNSKFMFFISRCYFFDSVCVSDQLSHDSVCVSNLCYHMCLQRIESHSTRVLCPMKI